MSDPTFTPEADRELLVVYPDLSHAEAARDALIEAGVPPGEVHVGEEPDTIVSLRAQMREELARPWIVPHAGVTHPRERSVAIVAGAGTALAVLLAFPIALVDFGSTTYWTRWFVVAVVGALFACTVGLFAGAAAAPLGRGEAPDATKGTLLRVGRDSAGLRRVLVDLGPIRVDEVTHDGDPITMVMHSDDRPQHP